MELNGAAVIATRIIRQNGYSEFSSNARVASAFLAPTRMMSLLAV
jgi:hypothetical protein